MWTENDGGREGINKKKTYTCKNCKLLVVLKTKINKDLINTILFKVNIN